MSPRPVSYFLLHTISTVERNWTKRFIAFCSCIVMFEPAVKLKACGKVALLSRQACSEPSMTTFNYGSGSLITHPEVAAIFADVPAAGLTWEDAYSPFPGTLLILLCHKIGTCRAGFHFRLIVWAHERLFFGARRATPTLCGLSRQPGAGRRAPGSSCAARIVLHRSTTSRRTQKRRAHPDKDPRL